MAPPLPPEPTSFWPLLMTEHFVASSLLAPLPMAFLGAPSVLKVSDGRGCSLRCAPARPPKSVLANGARRVGASRCVVS